jgi:16S rRNA (guanine966-N2)-methyltransferase
MTVKLERVTRIISGAAGSLRLEVPKSGTRPTSDRVREAIFSSLESWGLTEGVRVLDLYAGSGALGLEAASRGAAEVVLVEKHPPAAQIASRNSKIVLTAFRDDSAPVIDVVRGSVKTFLETAQHRGLFDVILIDPPYDLSEAELATNLVSVAPLLTDDGVVLVERSSRSAEPTWPTAPSPLGLLREKRYGETVLWWADRPEEK